MKKVVWFIITIYLTVIGIAHAGVFFKVGEDIEMNKLVFKVFSVHTASSFFGCNKVANGAIYITIHFGYKNISKKPISSIWNNPNINLFDPSGVKYTPDIMASACYAASIESNVKILSKINPGITIENGVVFEVEKKLWKEKGWKLKISSGASKKYEVLIVQ